MKYLYFHGFASSPHSTKATYFAERFAERGKQLVIPDLAEPGGFENLTISSQLQTIHEAAGDAAEITVLGSSLGGYLAALYAARHASVKRAVLLAPAFHFASRFPAAIGFEAASAWKESGRMAVFHYGDGRERQLGYQLMEDAADYEAEPDLKQPTLIHHGRLDPVVPANLSQGFASAHSNVELMLYESGHELTDVLPRMWAATAVFLGLE